MESTLTKICNVNRYYWDLSIPSVQWDYKTISQKLTRHTHFILVNRQEEVMPMEFIVPIFHIALMTGLTDRNMAEKILEDLMPLEEDCFVTGYHQHVQKSREKAWHDKSIK